MTSRFYSNSEASASELLQNLEEMLMSRNIDVKCHLKILHFQVSPHLCPIHLNVLFCKRINVLLKLCQLIKHIVVHPYLDLRHTQRSIVVLLFNGNT